MDILKKRFADFQQYLGHDFGDDDDVEGAVLFETLPLIGMVVLLFNALEKSIDSAICEAINDRTDSVGLLVIHGMPYGQKVDVYERLCEDLHATVEGPVPSFQGLIARLKAVSVLRNLVVHADWLSSDAKGYTYTRLHIKRGGMRQEYVQLTPDSMGKVAAAIQGASAQFDAYLDERGELLRDKRHDPPKVDAAEPPSLPA
ncbi:hypothetical protein WDL1CHR_06203 [Variovorax sp. WDL1]|uniref:hypothetical protein n=1 Tax=unclassified Variovorax TaxID=663243 RepID=UPI0008395DC0|nr:MULTISPECIES: hypothetical protein [unclassified Variovorax]PNG52291.1 hypothetical protein CHC07_04663 [Variovorax sp. B4]VTV15839.1 hypothetical protein WDL1CHR_06203 [Variovorax sp. WDL1]